MLVLRAVVHWMSRHFQNSRQILVVVHSVGSVLGPNTSGSHIIPSYCTFQHEELRFFFYSITVVQVNLVTY